MAQTPGGVYYQAPASATVTVDLADCTKTRDLLQALGQIGRASCRERVS
jgi:hypothetical protein